MTEENRIQEILTDETDEISRFVDSYASFGRIVNSLQRKYIDLTSQFELQNRELADTNRRLLDVSRQHLEATEVLNSILGSITAGVVSVNQDGQVTHFNPAASLILGIPVQEPLGKHYRDVIPPGTPVDANALRAAESGKECDWIEKRIELADGTRLQLSVSTSILRDKDGRSVGAVEVFQDLTKLRSMEQEIARLNTLAALGEMAATVAHEVRNPLSGIGGFAALLERDLADDDPRKKLVGKIIKGVDSLNATVDTLLSYTRFEEPKRRETDYQKFLQESIQQFRLDNSERLADIDLRLGNGSRPDKSPGSLRIDQILFRQILFNLFSNAVDACNGRGTISISASRLSRQKALSLYGDRLILGLDETVVETVVTDTGPGIPEEHIEKIFAPFFTTKSDGNGLGLAVAWKIIKAHGGDIWAENTESGARFRLAVPTRLQRTEEID